MTDRTGIGAPATRSLNVPHIDVAALGLSLSSFFVISYVLCIASGLIVPGWGLHQPWLQFFPRFEWLTLRGFLLGLVESVVYGWYAALVFRPRSTCLPRGADRGPDMANGMREAIAKALRSRSCAWAGRLT